MCKFINIPGFSELRICVFPATITRVAPLLSVSKKSKSETVSSVTSPITKVADYVLHNGNRQYLLQGDSIGTQIAQSFVLDLIYTLLVQAEEEKAITAKQKTVHVILEQRQK